MISKYGLVPLVVIFLINILSGVFGFYIKPDLWYISIVPIMLLMFSLYFFRMPKKPGVEDNKIVYSPATGKVVEVVESEESEFIKSKVTKITIFLSVVDCHVNVSPVKAVIDYINHVPGLKLNALDPRSSLENEYVLLGLKMANDLKISVRQIAGLIARRIICDRKVGAELNQCEVYGMIRFGSRTEICIPIDSGFTSSVKVGDKVNCGHSILGKFE
ncbi:MAG: phosphatidylserine decarboxylase family protein [Planctomycetota bacterium]|nr:MAG: phosphatidylserine decarboxylase family protein [Planctomycetota bacterium]